MDFINWLQQQQIMTDPADNARKLMSGFRQQVKEKPPVVGGWDPKGADLTGNTQPLIDPAKLNPGGYSDNTLPPLQQTTPETSTYGVADLSSDYVNDVTREYYNNSKFKPTDTSVVPSLLTSNYALEPMLQRYKGNRDMALIAKKMGPELMDALLSTYGVKWKDHLSDHLKALIA